MNRLHSRKSIRKPGYDYSTPGFYFITICTNGGKWIFGKVREGKMVGNDFGEIVQTCWVGWPDHYSDLNLDAFVIMPNHFHGILILKENEPGTRAGLRPAPTTIGEVVRGFKSFSSRRINDQRKTPGVPIWQRNYYDRIIRTERELNLTRLYILANPLLWNWDPDNTEAELPASVDETLIKQCGFTSEDYELIRNYVEYRKMR